MVIHTDTLNEAGYVADTLIAITVTRNGEAQFVLVSADDVEGLEITLEVLSDEGAVGRIAESLAGLESGDSSVTVRRQRRGARQDQALVVVA